MSVKGTTVIVTGSATGIGRYIAKTFGKAGANVVVADIRPLDTVLGELVGLGAEAVGVQTDVTNEDSVRNLIGVAYERFGRIDTLLNNAGIVTHFAVGAPRWPRIRDMDRSFFAKVVETNLLGAFLCSKHAIPYMESLNAGHIINFGQGDLKPFERKASIGACVYDTTKVALRAFTKHLAEEEREFNICVVSMGPGVARTEPRRQGAGVAGAGGGLVTEDSPPWARDPERGSTTVEAIGDNYVIAAEADISFTGRQITVRDGVVGLLEE